MTRLAHYRAMTTDEIVQCGYDAMAIVSLCENAAQDLAVRGENGNLAGDIGIALKLALKLISALHDTIEMSKSGEECHERAS